MKLQVGGFCIKGGGHIWTYDEGPDGCSGWELWIDLDPADIHLFPGWVQDLARWQIANDGACASDARVARAALAGGENTGT